jgi:hypothetical protein
VTSTKLGAVLVLTENKVTWSKVNTKRSEKRFTISPIYINKAILRLKPIFSNNYIPPIKA